MTSRRIGSKVAIKPSPTSENSYLQIVNSAPPQTSILQAVRAYFFLLNIPAIKHSRIPWRNKSRDNETLHLPKNFTAVSGEIQYRSLQFATPALYLIKPSYTPWFTSVRENATAEVASFVPLTSCPAGRGSFTVSSLSSYIYAHSHWVANIRCTNASVCRRTVLL